MKRTTFYLMNLLVNQRAGRTID